MPSLEPVLRFGLCRCVLLSLLLLLFLVVSSSTEQAASNDHNNVIDSAQDHGGIPMGKVPKCDDGETNIEIDWNPNSTNESTCWGEILKPNITMNVSECEDIPSEAIHICLNKSITYEDAPPTSGKHRPVWPVYGEYSYAPPQRWLHSLEHGGIVMLYHPCADPRQVQGMKEAVKGCLRKHVITPYPSLPENTPLAVLSWGCKLMMSHLRVEDVVDFIKNHANRGREGNVAAQGQYRAGLVDIAHVVSDIRDSQLCPNFRPTEHAQNMSNPTTTTTTTTAPTEEKDATTLSTPVNPIVEQSEHRQQDLERKTHTAQEDIEQLNESFQDLMSEE